MKEEPELDGKEIYVFEASNRSRDYVVETVVDIIIELVLEIDVEIKASIVGCRYGNLLNLLLRQSMKRQ